MRIILTTIFFLLFLCGCASTAPKQASSTPAQSQSQSVTVGGEIQMRGQYLKSN